MRQFQSISSSVQELVENDSRQYKQKQTHVFQLRGTGVWISEAFILQVQVFGHRIRARNGFITVTQIRHGNGASSSFRVTAPAVLGVQDGRPAVLGQIRVFVSSVHNLETRRAIVSDSSVPGCVDLQFQPVTAKQIVTAPFAEVGMLFAVGMGGTRGREGSKGKDEQGQLVQHDWSRAVIT